MFIVYVLELMFIVISVKASNGTLVVLLGILKLCLELHIEDMLNCVMWSMQLYVIFYFTWLPTVGKFAQLYC